MIKSGLFILTLIVGVSAVSQSFSDFSLKFQEAVFPYEAPRVLPTSAEEVELFFGKTHQKVETSQVKKFLDLEFNEEEDCYFGLHHLKISETQDAYVVLHLMRKNDIGSYNNCYYQMVVTENNNPKMVIDIAWNNKQDANPEYGEDQVDSKFSGKYVVKDGFIHEYPRSFDYLTNQSWQGGYREYSLKTYEQKANLDDEGY